MADESEELAVFVARAVGGGAGWQRYHQLHEGSLTWQVAGRPNA